MRFVSLISGGIDSPVATYLILKQGAEIIAVHMDVRFSTKKIDVPLSKVVKLVELLAEKSSKKIKLYNVPHGQTLKTIITKCPRHLTCILCRRIMYRVAEQIAKKENAKGIITGENLGQVASQTLDNIYVEDKAVKLPVHRPLIGFDKEETIKIAKEIGTYDISIQRGGCCDLFPQYPETHAKLKEIEDAERNLNIKGMVKDAIKDAKILIIGK